MASHRQVRDAGVLGLAGTVRHDHPIAVAGGQAQHLLHLRQRADLVGLDQDGIGQALPDALLEQARIGAEHVVADQLATGAQPFGEHFPAGGVVLGHAVLDGDDRIGPRQRRQVVDLLLGAQAPVLSGIDVAGGPMKFAGGRIQAQRDVLAGPESGLSDRRHQEVQRFLGRAQIGREAALVAHVDRMAGAFQGVLERMEHFGAHAHRLGEAGRAHRQHHEFLEIQRIVGMGAAVEHVDHGHRHDAGLAAAHITPQRQFQAGRRRAPASDTPTIALAPRRLCRACRPARSWPGPGPSGGRRACPAAHRALPC